MINVTVIVIVTSVTSSISIPLWYNHTRFKKWDNIVQAIVLVSYAELFNSEKNMFKIIINDYLEISKLFVTMQETKFINAILDKVINE